MFLNCYQEIQGIHEHDSHEAHNAENFLINLLIISDHCQWYKPVTLRFLVLYGVSTEISFHFHLLVR